MGGPKLDETNSRVYRPRSDRVKLAIIRWEPARYALSQGVQNFGGPHVVVADGEGEYGVDLDAFFSTHRPVPALPHHYVKSSRVRATQVEVTTEVVTILDGVEEMRAAARPGEFIVQNPQGEVYSMTREEFEARYEFDE